MGTSIVLIVKVICQGFIGNYLCIREGNIPQIEIGGGGGTLGGKSQFPTPMRCSLMCLGVLCCCREAIAELRKLLDRLQDQQPKANATAELVSHPLITCM